MAQFLLRRALGGAATLFLFVTAVFFLVQVLLPYDFATQFQFGDALAGERVREQLGLDEPLVSRYLDYLATLAQGSLGTSLSGEPVSAILAEALPTTVLVFVVGGVLAFLLGSWLGRVIGWTRRRTLGGLATGAAVVAYTAFPPLLVFILGRLLAEPLASLRTAVGLPLSSGLVWAGSDWSREAVLWLVGLSLLAWIGGALVLEGALRRRGRSRTWRLVLVPVLGCGVVGTWFALGAGTQALDLVTTVGTASPLLAVLVFVTVAFGEVMLVTRTTVAAELSRDYVFAARARAVPGDTIRDRHVARNVMLPVLSRFYVGLPFLVTGLIVIELSLGTRGVASVLFAAVEDADIPVITGTLLVIGIFMLALRLVLELLHAWVDPRLRPGASP